MTRLRTAGQQWHGAVQVAAGMTVMGCVFVVAESLAFLDEHLGSA